jgi:hypothetical protein
VGMRGIVAVSPAISYRPGLDYACNEENRDNGEFFAKLSI